jgi:HK97 gp10 family phage protein
VPTRVVVVYDHLPRCAAVALAEADELNTDVARDMHQGAQAAAPVRTGALRRGINLQEGNPAEVTASSLEGGAPREYALYNEFGTRYMSANPFMMPGYVAGLAQLPVHAREYGHKIEAAA